GGTGAEGRMRLGRDVEAIGALLCKHAKGGSLAALYKLVPGSLRGYVELVYDAATQASARYIEALLYRSPHYDPTLQSIALRIISNDRRDPQFTTPLLAHDPSLSLRVPFAHDAVDDLFSMKTRPRPAEEMRERLGIHHDDAAQFRGLLTSQPPPPRRGAPQGVSIRYFGHACVLLETPEVSILVDPVISYAYPGGPGRYS